MAEFVAFDSNVEVHADNPLMLIELLSNKAAATKIFEQHDIILVPDQWYPLQNVLNAFREVSQLDFFDMVAIGMRVPDYLNFPPQINTVEMALGTFDMAYQIKHRNGDAGGFAFEKTGNRSGKIVCRNPYPSDFDYGVIYRIVQKFKDNATTSSSVKPDSNAPSRKNGDDSCTFLIEW